MVTLYCIANLKKPCHVGFGTGKQVRDIRKKPVVPSLTLTTQINALSLRLAKSANREPPVVRASDGFVVGEAKIQSVRGQEFFLGKITFTVQVNERDLDIVLGTLKLLQNYGIGANTSMGFGYCEIKIVRTSKGAPQAIVEKANPKAADLVGEDEFQQPNIAVRFAQAIFNKLKINWHSWFKAMDTSPLKRIVYLTGETEIKNPFAYRGWLRARLLENFPYDHPGNVTICPPKGKPCRVCSLMGRMGEKSRIIVRMFAKKDGKSAVWVIADNPTDEELVVLQEVGGLRVVREEGLDAFLPTR